MSNFAKRPRVAVLFASGAEETVHLSIQDQLQWSRTSRARGWRPDDELLAQTFMSWHALKQAGRYAGTFEAFSERDAQWIAEAPENDEDDQPDEADPFQ